MLWLIFNILLQPPHLHHPRHQPSPSDCLPRWDHRGVQKAVIVPGGHQILFCREANPLQVWQDFQICGIWAVRICKNVFEIGRIDIFCAITLASSLECEVVLFWQKILLNWRNYEWPGLWVCMHAGTSVRSAVENAYKQKSEAGQHFEQKICH